MAVKEGKAHILVVDDDPVASGLVAGCLQIDGHLMSRAADGEAMEGLLREQPVDLVILDINLPGKDGFTLARELRARSEIGIILITERKEDLDCIIGLEMGADDYITKPFNPRELRARVRSLLRRVSAIASSQDQSPVLRFNGWYLHTGARNLVSPEGEETRLPSGEFKLLCAFLQKPNVVLSRERLQSIIGGGSDTTSRTIDVLIGRLRQKLREDPRNPKLIVTIHGEGYICTAEAY
jgi:two-component system torCAD operon response regulator TorR